MTTRQLAEQDIREDLKTSGKSFIAFRRELNPVMRKLVSRQINDQRNLNFYPAPPTSSIQIMARCLFAKGEVKLENYTKYY